jgi:hypothetical protein
MSTVASGAIQFVIGANNAEKSCTYIASDPSTSTEPSLSGTLFIIGNSADSTKKSNIVEVDTNKLRVFGDIVLAETDENGDTVEICSLRDIWNKVKDL